MSPCSVFAFLVIGFFGLVGFACLLAKLPSDDDELPVDSGLRKEDL